MNDVSMMSWSSIEELRQRYHQNVLLCNNNEITACIADLFNSFCEEMYVVAFFKIMQQQSIGEVANSIRPTEGRTDRQNITTVLPYIAAKNIGYLTIDNFSQKLLDIFVEIFHNYFRGLYGASWLMYCVCVCGRRRASSTCRSDPRIARAHPAREDVNVPLASSIWWNAALIGRRPRWTSDAAHPPLILTVLPHRRKL